MVFKIILFVFLCGFFAAHADEETDYNVDSLSPADETRGGPLERPARPLNEDREEFPEEEQEGSTEIGPESLEEAIDEMNSKREGQDHEL
ncbi:MAG: hypothetical protein ACLGHN_00950 [Bacteriovoracia bacterium]